MQPTTNALSTGGLVRRVLLFGLAYFACAALSSYFVFKPGSFVNFWMPSGLFVSTLLLQESKHWPWFVMAAFPANLGFDLLNGQSLPVTFLFTCGNSLEAVVGAWLVRRSQGERATWCSVRAAGALIGFSALLSTTLSATNGTAIVTQLMGGGPFWSTWLLWWSGDALGVLMVAPMILVWHDKLLWLPPRVHSARLGEGLAFGIGLTLATIFICLADWHPYFDLKYAVIPFILWTAMRYRQTGTTVVSFWIALLVTWFTVHGYSEIAAVGLAPQIQVAELQLFLAVAIATGLILSAVWEEQIQTEEQLRSSELALRGILEAVNESVFLIDLEGRVRVLNATTARRLQTTPEKIQGQRIYDFLPPDLAHSRQSHVEHAIRSGRPTQFEDQRGQSWLEHTIYPITDVQGQVTQLVAFGRDITERKRVELELLLAKDRFELAQSAADCGVWDWDIASGRLEWSRELFILFGLEPGHAAASFEAWQSVLHPEDLQVASERIKKSLQDETPLNSEYRVLHRDGQVRWIHAFGRATYDAAHQPLRMAGICLDITERKQAEKELALATELLQLTNVSRSTRELVQSAVTFLCQHSGCEAVGVRLREADDYPYFEARGFPPEFVQAETHLCLRDNLGQPILDATGNPVLECMCGNIICGRFDPAKPFFTANGSFWTNSTSQLLASTSEADRQARTRNRCHGEGYESVALFPLRVGDDRLGLLQLNDRRPGRFSPGVIAFWERLANSLSISLARMRSEEALRASLREKEAMLKEIHHRVKNNLQLMSSLLNLQADRTANPVIQSALAVTQSRIQSMALLHESLYRHGDLAWLELSACLESLIAQVLRSFQEAGGRVKVQLRLDRIKVDVDQAVPCGLILNELLTNSLKHAFPNQRQGEILVELHLSEARQVQLRVTDNGVGFPPGLNLSQPQTLGFQLVSDLSAQLGGQHAVKEGPGVAIEISFPLAAI
jgi:PAS domain S-box-containing protein